MSDVTEDPLGTDEFSKYKTSTPRNGETNNSAETAKPRDNKTIKGNEKATISDKEKLTNSGEKETRKGCDKSKDLEGKNIENVKKSIGDKTIKEDGHSERATEGKAKKTIKNDKNLQLQEENVGNNSQPTDKKRRKTSGTKHMQTGDQKANQNHIQTKKKNDIDGKNSDKKEEKKRTLSEENEENEEEDDSEEETEMTSEEKEDMYNAVRNGDFLGLNNALDKKNADINMTWYGENLLMAAIRSDQTEIAEYLIDIGIDQNFKAKYYNLREKDKKGKRVDCHEKSCRDLAFDLGNDHIVEVIDVKNNNVFPFVPISPRTLWNKRPPAPELPKHLRPLTDIDSDEETTDDEDNSTELDSGHPSARSNEKTNEDSSFSEMLDRLGKDEGYGTMSPSVSPYLIHSNSNIQPEKPRLLYRPTKASMALQTHNDKHYGRRPPSKSAPSVRNIEIIGSYSHEKRQWQPKREKSDFSETISLQSLPFFRSFPSSAKSSKRKSAVSSAITEVTKILRQSPLLTTKSDLENPFRSTQRSKTIIPSLKINQWCHNNATSVFDRLSNRKNNQRNKSANFSVNRDFIPQH